MHACIYIPKSNHMADLIAARYCYNYKIAHFSGANKKTVVQTDCVLLLYCPLNTHTHTHTQSVYAVGGLCLSVSFFSFSFLWFRSFSSNLNKMSLTTSPKSVSLSVCVCVSVCLVGWAINQAG